MVRFLLELDECVLECDANAGCGDATGASGSQNTVVVVTHPWGRLGGCMGDPTVVAQCAAAQRSGLFTGVISYNQRCVGRSRGKSRSSSDPDADDLAALCRHLLAQPLPEAAAPARRLVLIGYSYGSCVAAQALSRVPQVVAYVSISFPLGVLSRWFLGAGASWAALAASPLPKLLMIGDADNFTSAGQLRDAVARHDATPGAGPLVVKLVSGADHFWGGLWDDVARVVQEWLAARLAGADAEVALGAAAAAAEGSDGRRAGGEQASRAPAAAG